MSRRYVRAVAVLAVLATAALVAGALGKTNASSHSRGRLTENGRVSEAFAQHQEDLFASKVGSAAESPTSWADEQYQLNGGDSISSIRRF